MADTTRNIYYLIDIQNGILVDDLKNESASAIEFDNNIQSIIDADVNGTVIIGNATFKCSVATKERAEVLQNLVNAGKIVY